MPAACAACPNQLGCCRFYRTCGSVRHGRPANGPAELSRVRIARSAAVKLPLLLAVVAVPGPIGAGTIASPLRFFEGATESVGILSIVLQRPRSSRSHGTGSIASDGSLRLVQRVEDEGQPPHLRHWNIRQVAPGRFTGSMSEATSPLRIERVGDRYRFRFRMKGGLSVEEWLTPSAGGRSADNELTVRKFGIIVATFRGIVRKGA